MAPRAYWKGYLRLSLVTCPVELYPATSLSERTHFHMINKDTGNRLHQQMVDEKTGEVVERESKGRGYEVSKGQYVEIEEEELEAIEIESTHTVDIDSFVPRAEIDNRYLDRPYYIAPGDKVGAEAFGVIRDAMRDKDRVALARIVTGHREHVIALEPMGDGILGTMLRYDYEVRDERPVFSGIPSAKVGRDMVELAAHILDSKAGHFDPRKFRDRYETALRALVKRKAAGKPIEAPQKPRPSAEVIDLMDALKRSLAGGKAPRAGKAARRKTAKTTKSRRKAA